MTVGRNRAKKIFEEEMKLSGQVFQYMYNRVSSRHFHKGGGGGGGAKYTSELTLLWLMGIGAPHHDYNNFCAFTRVVQHMYMYTMYIIYCIYMFIYMYTCNQGA